MLIFCSSVSAATNNYWSLRLACLLHPLIGAGDKKIYGRLYRLVKEILCATFAIPSQGDYISYVR